RSPARTSGPHRTAAFAGLSFNRSSFNTFGSTSAISSPDFHVRLISTYEPAAAGEPIAWPLTRTANPSPAHDGRRNRIVRAFGVRTSSFSVAVSPSGKD